MLLKFSKQPASMIRIIIKLYVSHNMCIIKNVGNGDEIWIAPLNFIPWKIGKEQTRVTLKELNTAKLN
jgi:hypothetical protein